ncbi:DUF2294 family protein [Paenibacillus sp. HJL G12]|uniref:DUF2294 family protein n=1 Tax=Paenibacillus dendrobii TaxID=2691084 RepID=A0A7X3IFV3_9BACL|nr:Na-translocating system protein MpsC family protein [Paenibacillus dendrobii]MWV43075.1 DUF2294 family protein [Paenibacillus dendrobii]
MARLEIELGKLFAKLRKEFTGTGAIDTQVRICADSLYVRYKVSYTALEKALVKFLRDDSGSITIPDYTETAKQMIDNLMLPLFPIEKVKVKGLFTRIFIEECSEASYWLVIFDKNIEKLAREYERKDHPERHMNRKLLSIALPALIIPLAKAIGIFEISPYV